MSDTQLRMHLQELHDLLQKPLALDDADTTLLTDLKTDIAAILEQKEAQEYQDFPSLTKRLQESVEKFEISHPVLTNAFTNIITTLNNMGV